MQQLPVLSTAPLAPARPGQGTAAGARGSGPQQDAVDLRQSRRPARQPDPAIRERWRHSSTPSERTYDRNSGTPSGVREPLVASTALQAVAPGFVAQLIGQFPGVRTTATGQGQALTAALASSAYRQAGAEPSPAGPTAPHFDIAV